MKPSSIFILKRISKWYIKQENYSNAYNYLTNAIKIDNREEELYALLSEYYKENNDSIKYYECCIQELENSQAYSINSILSEIYSLEVV